LSPSPTLALYIHWPYCARICPYCDFNVVRARGRDGERSALLAALEADIAAHARRLGSRQLTSIFFGGGTPSLLEPAEVARLIAAARRVFAANDELEITLEANPTDAEAKRFADLAAIGVNRLSLGLQSLDDAELAFLGRNHDAAAGRAALAAAQSAFARVSVDLIYALPEQAPEAWRRRLAEVAGSGVEHVSAYQLTIEPSTAFARAVARGRLAPADEERAAEMFAITDEVLSRLGFEAYEVSNHARGKAARSRHNQAYWRGEEYAGIGPGSHGRLRDGATWLASEAPRSISAYVAHVERQGLGAKLTPLSARERALERLLMGLRTIDGVAEGDLAALDLSEGRLGQLAGFVGRRDGRLRATARGRRVLDRVIAELADAA
jgi:oxygen-independent coproporphyrinogen-3 oxidase